MGRINKKRPARVVGHPDEAGKTHCRSNGLVGDIIASSFKLRKAKEEYFLKFDCKLPGSVEIHFEREPLSRERFEMICWLIGIIVIGSCVIHLFALAARR